MTIKQAIDIIKHTPIYRQEEGKETHSELFEALELAVEALELEYAIGASVVMDLFRIEVSEVKDE